jgi:hypothetical protein
MRRAAMRRKHVMLAVIWLELICTACLAIAEDVRHRERPTAKGVAQLVGEKGSKQAVRSLFSDPLTWNDVLQGIGTGRNEWLALAPMLRPGTDGASAEELAMALQAALPIAPARVLDMTSIQDDVKTFPVRDACGGYGFGQIEDTRPKTTILGLIRQRQGAVTKVTDAALAERRAECLRELGRLEAAILKR